LAAVPCRTLRQHGAADRSAAGEIQLSGRIRG
jgi:hypothetical protein